MKINLINEINNFNYEGQIIVINEKTSDIKGISLSLDGLKDSKRFEAKVGDNYRFTLSDNNKLIEVVLVSLGSDSLSYRKLLNIFGDAYRLLSKQKVSNVAFNLQNIDIDENMIKSVSEAVIMAEYKFNTYLTKKDELLDISVDIVINSDENYSDIISEVQILADSTLIARQLVNEPSNILHPELLAKKTETLGEEYGFEVDVLNKKNIQELKMEAFLAVAKGSEAEPKFIIMRYQGDPENKDILGLVGKGLTYDSGGLSIKPTASMVDMKSDMAGAAAVIGAMCAISKNKLKINVTAVIAACENMISGTAYRPGDILDSMGGKSIFIGNTDAEGRLTLIDAMHFIVTKESINRVVDIATLTGAAIHCTGDVAAPAISNSDEFFNSLQKSYDLSGELIWRMPIFEEYKELIKHKEADLTNTAGSPGTITAGLFIGEFTGDLPWIHIDIAGPSMAKKDNGILSKGGTGCGVRPLYYLAKELIN